MAFTKRESKKTACSVFIEWHFEGRVSFLVAGAGRMGFSGNRDSVNVYFIGARVQLCEAYFLDESWYYTIVAFILDSLIRTCTFSYIIPSKAPFPLSTPKRFQSR